MLGYQHSGFSVDTSVCIDAQDRAGLERLLRYCARPPFALDRLRKAGSDLIYRCAKQRSEPGSGQPGQRGARRYAKHGAQADELHLTPLELIARLAALVPPPRSHRHRYHCVLAPNSPHRAAAVALAAGQTAGTGTAQPEPGGEPATTEVTAKAMGVATAGAPGQPEPTEPARPKRPAHILWAVLIARIYEVFPLLCPICGGQMRIIAFITHSADIRQILEHIGVEAEPPRITPAGGPSLWHGCDAPIGEGVEVAPNWDEVAQPAPDFEADQRISW
jgi:hypothetical protein